MIIEKHNRAFTCEDGGLNYRDELGEFGVGVVVGVAGGAVGGGGGGVPGGGVATMEA